MPFPRVVFPVLFASTALLSQFAVAGTPSFLCTKATTWIEKTICASDRLSELDLELASVYARLLRGGDVNAKRALESDQRKWWAERAQCQKIADPAGCVEHTYTTRISHLRSRPDYPGDVPAAMAPKIIQESPIKEVGQGWAKNLSEYFKAIKLCVGRSRVPVQAVLFAAKEDRDLVSMWLRVQDPENDTLHCLATKDGSQLKQMRAKEVYEDLPATGPVLFLGATEPKNKCEKPVLVLDPSGRDFGWITPGPCNG